MSIRLLKCMPSPRRASRGFRWMGRGGEQAVRLHVGCKAGRRGNHSARTMSMSEGMLFLRRS